MSNQSRNRNHVQPETYRLNWRKSIKASLTALAIRLALRFVWLTCRVERVHGEEHIRKFFESKTPCLPCYWHQMQVICGYYLRRWHQQGLRVGFLISPSVDGETAARMAQGWGMRVVRGSSSRTGAQALRDCYSVITKEKVSLIFNADGPRGPLHEFKPGAVLLSQLSSAPIVPLAFATDRAWRLNSWDRSIIPKPFARIVIAIGEPHPVPKQADLETERTHINRALKHITQVAEELLLANK